MQELNAASDQTSRPKTVLEAPTGPIGVPVEKAEPDLVETGEPAAPV